MKKKIMFSLTTIMITALLGGCGSSSASSAKYDAEYESAAYSADYMAEEAVAASEYYSDDIYEAKSTDGADNTSATNEQLESASNSRKLIKTVNMSVQTKEFDKFVATVSSRIESLGGYAETMEVNGYEYNASDYSTRDAYIVARIPQENLNGFVECVSDNSNIVSKNESASDVTLEYADVEAHRDSLRVEQERLNELLEEADSLETIIALESRLTEVRYELESYESRLRSINNKVVFSTVYLNVREVKDYTPVVVEEKTFGQRVAEGFTNGCKSALEGLEDFIVGFLSILPGLIITLLIIALFVFVIVMIIKWIVSLIRKASAKSAIKKANKIAAANAKVNAENNTPVTKVEVVKADAPKKEESDDK